MIGWQGEEKKKKRKKKKGNGVEQGQRALQCLHL